MTKDFDVIDFSNIIAWNAEKIVVTRQHPLDHSFLCGLDFCEHRNSKTCYIIMETHFNDTFDASVFLYRLFLPPSYYIIIYNISIILVLRIDEYLGSIQRGRTRLGRGQNKTKTYVSKQRRNFNCWNLRKQ